VGGPAPHAGFISLSSDKETEPKKPLPAGGFHVRLSLHLFNDGGWEIDFSRLRLASVVVAVSCRSRWRDVMELLKNSMGKPKAKKIKKAGVRRFIE
jgi:hypothetical protein